MHTNICCCYLVANCHLNLLVSYGLQPVSLLCPWNSPGKNTRVGSHSLFQQIFPTQGLNGSPALQVDSLSSEPPGKPIHISVYVYILFSILFHYRLLQNIACSSLCYRVISCCLFYIQYYLHLLISYSLFITPLPNFVNISLFSMSVSLFLLCSFVLFLRFYI